MGPNLVALVASLSLAAGCADWDTPFACSNHVRDGDETGVDCGGSCNRACAAAPDGGTGAGGTGGGGGADAGPLSRLGGPCASDADCAQPAECLEGHCSPKDPARRWRILVGAGSSPTPARARAAATFDESKGLVVLVAGVANANNFLNDAWTMAVAGGTAKWTKLADPPPLAQCYAMQAAYDGVRKQSVFAGGMGIDGTALPDAYLFDGSAWTSIDDLQHHRAFGRGAFDSVRKRVLVFGGDDTLGGPGQLEQLDSASTSWQIVPATGTLPGDLDFPSVAFDDARGRLVVFGGAKTYNGGATSGTFELDVQRQAWEQRTGLGCLGGDGGLPEGRVGAAFAYDSYRHRIVMWGGGVDWNNLIVSAGQAWEYDGNAWCPVSVTAVKPPENRIHPSFVYDSIRRRMVLVGGRGGANDYGATWALDTYGIPCADDDHCSTGNCIDGACCPEDCLTGGYGCNDPAEPGKCKPVR